MGLGQSIGYLVDNYEMEKLYWIHIWVHNCMAEAPYLPTALWDYGNYDIPLHNLNPLLIFHQRMTPLNAFLLM